MNREEFIEVIKKIGWDVFPSWNGLNDVLRSPTGVLTEIRVNEDSLEPYSNELYGGESFYIQAKWYFKDAKINEKDGYVSINNLLLMNPKI